MARTKIVGLLLMASVVVTAGIVVYRGLEPETGPSPGLRPLADAVPKREVPASSAPVSAAPSRTTVATLPSPVPKPPAAAPVRPGNAKLPTLVGEMRDAILAAVHSGRLDELLIPIQWNEMRPDFGEAAGVSPLDHLKTVSADGTGRDVLRLLDSLLATEPAVVPLGRDIENNRLFVWPGLAERKLTSLSADDRADLDRLAGSPAAAQAMISVGRYTGWRLSIGADGTWHSFKRVE